MLAATLSPDERYADLIDQGYTPEHAARRSGFTPTPVPAPRPALVLVPTYPNLIRTGRKPGMLNPPTFPAIPDAPLGNARWREDALCAEIDSDLFFPEKGESSRDAKAICLACEVTADCLAYALKTKQRFGIWGGLSAQQRHALTKS